MPSAPEVPAQGGSVPRVPELLSPAGTPAAFDAALAAGADAIYLGFGNDFNARRSAANFDDEALGAACRKAHLAGARVYVTMNVVIKDEEMAAALAQARRAWLLGADALIVQDWGLLTELRRRWPQIECHASTQAAIMDARGCAWARDRGCERVTLARELSLEEMASCARAGVELEAFGHGAICFCYSGLCLLSSSSGERSANRGLCAQPCRLPWELVDGQGRRVAAPGRDRPLCPRDLRTLEDLAALARSDVGSLKVEGRMKAPEYVFAVTRAYRLALDALAEGRALADGERAEAERLLARAFNRDFTNAYLHGTSGDELMSYGRSNNRGELVGAVTGGRELAPLRVRRGGGEGGRERTRVLRRAEVEVALDRPVGAGDLLEIRPVDDPSQFLTATARVAAAAGERIVVEAARVMPTGSAVRVIRSQEALEAVGRLSSSVPRRRAVGLRVEARLGRPLAVEIATCDGLFSARAEGMVVEAARTRAVGAAELEEHACRLGATPFVAASCVVEADAGVGLPFSALHRVRTEAARLLEEAILVPYAGRERNCALAPRAEEIRAHLAHLRLAGPLPGSGEAPRLAAPAEGAAARRAGDDAAPGLGLGETPRRGSPCDSLPAKPEVGRDIARVAVLGKHRAAEVVATGRGSAELCVLAPSAEVAHAAVCAGAGRVYASVDALGQGAWPARVPVTPWLDEVCREADHARLDPWVVRGAAVAVGNVSQLALAADVGALPELRPCVPIHNESALVALEEAGASGVWLSGELSLPEVCALARAARVPVGLVVWGRGRVMTSEHCVLQASARCPGDCARCQLRKARHFLRNDRGDLLGVTTDARGRSRIFAARPLDATPQLAELLAAGVSRLMVDATLCTPEEATAAVGRVASALDAVCAGRRPPVRAREAVSGHLHFPIR